MVACSVSIFYGQKRPGGLPCNFNGLGRLSIGWP
jgi:hypothetical protein